MVKRFYILTVFIFLGTFNAFSQKNFNTLIYEGNKEFSNKNYDKSSTKYMEAVKLDSKNFTGHYNLANSLYKAGKYEEAKAEYEKASKLAKSPEDKIAATYNLGNSYMKSNNHEKAAETYKKALKADPYNETIRKNYEIAMLKNKEEQQKNQQNQDQDQSKDGKDGKDQNQGDDQKQNPNGQQQNGNGNQDQEGKDENGNKPNQNNEQENGNRNMPKDLEDAVLNRVKNKEQETARKILNKDTYSMPQSNEKDW